MARKAPSIAVCIASFNRRETTLRCLRALFSSNVDEELLIDVFLVDDASSDGTADAVEGEFTKVNVIRADGDRYWAGGMRIAYEAALARGYDYYVWLNDDVELYAGAIRRSIETELELRRKVGGDHLVVGAMQDPKTGLTSYSGFINTSPIFPWIFRQIEPDAEEPKECTTINGNFVLIPANLAKQTGPIHSAYKHSLADLDLGLKVRRVGGRNWVLPGYAGRCSPNTGGRKSYKMRGLTLRQRLDALEHPLGYPFRASVVYAKNFGFWGPLVVGIPYISLFYRTLVELTGRLRKP